MCLFWIKFLLKQNKCFLNFQQISIDLHFVSPSNNGQWESVGSDLIRSEIPSFPRCTCIIVLSMGVKAVGEDLRVAQLYLDYEKKIKNMYK